MGIFWRSKDGPLAGPNENSRGIRQGRFGYQPLPAPGRSLDGDGDLDIIASGRSGLYWLENLLKKKKP